MIVWLRLGKLSKLLWPLSGQHAWYEKYQEHKDGGSRGTFSCTLSSAVIVCCILDRILSSLFPSLDVFSLSINNNT